MNDRISHRRRDDGALVIRLDKADHAELTRGFEDVLATLTPNHRRNFLRLSLRYANARLAQGVDPLGLFADGPASFRAALARWHRNESGRFAWDWDGRKITVYLEGREDEDITEALNLVLASHFENSRRKYRPFLLSFINFAVEVGEDPHAFVAETLERVRRRMDEWIRQELELVIDPLNGRPDSTVDVRSEEGSVNHRALGIAAVRQLYTVLRESLRLRTGPNPIDFDGLEAMEFGEKMDLARTLYGKIDRLPKHFGNQYVVKGRTTYAPIPHNPEQTYLVMTSAVDQLGRFPPVLEDVLAVMDAEGPRHHDVKNKTMDDWAASDFDEWIWGDNKGSDDPHYKQIIFGPKVMTRMRARIDAEHHSYPNRPKTTDELIARVSAGLGARPSVEQLLELKARGRHDILARIPLFPSSRGTPYSYTGWNYWIRLATESANGGEGARIITSVGPVRPTGVWLRRAMFTERVKNVQKTTDDPKTIRIKLDQIRSDAGHRSAGPIYRYAASAFPDLFGKEHKARAQDSRDRVDAVRAGIAEQIVVTVRPATVLSEKSTRLRSRARA